MEITSLTVDEIQKSKTKELFSLAEDSYSDLDGMEPQDEYDESTVTNQLKALENITKIVKECLNRKCGRAMIEDEIGFLEDVYNGHAGEVSAHNDDDSLTEEQAEVWNRIPCTWNEIFQPQEMEVTTLERRIRGSAMDWE